MRMVAVEMTEKAFQAQVVAFLQDHGYLVYHTFDSRRCEPGYPDLDVVAGPKWRSCYIAHFYVELKREHGRITDDQQKWIDCLRAVGETVHVWRPSEWPNIQRLFDLPASRTAIAKDRNDRVSYLEARKLMAGKE